MRKQPFPPSSRRIATAIIAGLVYSSVATAGVLDDRTQLIQEHSDIRVIYDPAATPPLSLVLRNEAQRTNYLATNIVVVVPESARLELPDGFTDLGPARSPLWILQQSQVDGQPFLGLSTEGLPVGTFQREAQFRLLGITGPGQFLAWQATDFGDLAIAFNTRNGVSSEDVKPALVGSHEHLNWGFTAPGYYYVTLQAELTAASGAPVHTDPTTFLFAVQPLPVVSPYAAWQQLHFPPDAAASIAGPDGDPDHDGYSNLIEFFWGTDPQVADRTGRSGVELTSEGHARIFYLTPAARRDQITPQVMRRDPVDGSASITLPELTIAAAPPPPGETGDWIRWSIVDPTPAASLTRFYSLHLSRP